jgi:hypothetical protein
MLFMALAAGMAHAHYAALGKTTAACSTVNELSNKATHAPAQVRRDAKRAVRKAGYQ